MSFSLQWIPLFTVVFGLICGSGIYVCLHFDNTLDVKINLSRDKSDLPDYALVILKVVRYLAGCYVMSALALFWSITVCVMHITGYSMLEFHGMYVMSKSDPYLITYPGKVLGKVRVGVFV